MRLLRLAAVSVVTFIALLFLLAYLLPFANGVSDALTIETRRCGGPGCFTIPQTYTYPPGGASCDNNNQCPLYNVPQPDGTIKQWALIYGRRTSSDFIDPANPSAGPFTWQGQWRTLEEVPEPAAPHLDNFVNVLKFLNFPLLLHNTLVIALAGVVGTLLSSICVAYGFARFPIPGKKYLFIILVAALLVPPQITLIPLYAAFSQIGWTGTWLPLIVPTFFANGCAVFLLREYFLMLSRDLEEAAIMDGASPLQVLRKVIIPQSWPVIGVVAVFYFIYMWNDFLNPLVYLAGHGDLATLSVSVQQELSHYQPEVAQAGSVLLLIIPMALFLFTHRGFLRGAEIARHGLLRKWWQPQAHSY